MDRVNIVCNIVSTIEGLHPSGKTAARTVAGQPRLDLRLAMMHSMRTGNSSYYEAARGVALAWASLTVSGFSTFPGA